MIDVKSQVYKSLNKTMQDFQDINQAKTKKKNNSNAFVMSIQF